MGGVSGWYINRGGSAEFNNIYARGDIRATSVTADTITADNIISGSLGQYFTTTSGFVSFNVPIGCQAIRITAYPEGNIEYVSKDGAPIVTVPTINFALDGVPKLVVSVSGTYFILGASPGSHTITATLSPTVFYTGRWFAEVIVR
ncbi:hypothetical protein D3C87_1714460 [compost metagenome]